MTFLALKPCSTGTHAQTKGFLSSSYSAPEQQSQFQHTITNGITGFRLVYGNWFNEYQTTGLSAMNVRAGVQINGTYIPVLFDGYRNVSIPVGGFVVSDLIRRPMARGDSLPVRTLAWGPAFPLGRVAGETGETNERGDGLTDKTLTGTLDNDAFFAYGPTMILGYGEIGKTRGAVLLIGDSIGDGQAGNETSSFLIRACGEANPPVPYIHACRSGSRASYIQGAPAHVDALLEAADFMVCQLGTNDIADGTAFATVQTRLQAVWARAALQNVPVYQTTITPWSSSTDSFATVGNQTPLASEAVRVAINDWIRTTPSPLAGYFEVADTVESARNSGKWKVPGYVVDGVHPQAVAGHTAMMPAITTSQFAVTPAPVQPAPSGSYSSFLLARRAATGF